MYVAVKGGEQAISRSLELLAEARRGDPSIPELSLDQIREQLRLGVARVMQEGSLYDEELAALAMRQAAGDMLEAIFYCAPIAPPCRALAIPDRWIPTRCAYVGAFPARSKISPAARC